MTHKPTAVSLLPCPFCGESPKAHQNDLAHNLWRYRCENCDAGPHGAIGTDAAAEAWNRRAALAAQPEKPAQACSVNHDDYVGRCPRCKMSLPSIREKLAQQSAHPTDGWVTVPREPTEEMLAAVRADPSVPRDIYRAMTSAAPQPQEWREIETAPKDGCDILLYTVHPGDSYYPEPFDAVQIGCWDEGNDTPDPIWRREPGWETERIGTPTHWMPLPLPPEKEGE